MIIPEFYVNLRRIEKAILLTNNKLKQNYDQTWY